MKFKELFLVNKSLKQTLFKNLSWLFFSEIVTRFFTFFLTIFMARILGAEDYGLLGFAMAFTGFFLIITNFCNNEIVIREYNQREEAKKEIGTVVWFRVFLGLLSFVLIVVFSFFVKDPLARQLIMIFGAVFLLDRTILLFLSLFKAVSKMEYVALINILQIIILSAGVFLVLFADPNVVFVSFAYLVSVALAVLAAVIMAKRLKIVSWPVLDFKIIKRYLSFSWPLALGSVFSVIYLQIDSVMMGFWGMIKQVGWYSAAYKITNFVVFPASLIQAAFYPVISKLYVKEKERFKRIINVFFELISFFVFPIVAGGFLLSSEIIIFLYGNEFLPSILAFQILIFSSGMILFIVFANSLLNATGNQKVIFYTAFIVALLNVALDFVLIPKYSFYGAAIATSLSYLLLFFLRFLIIKKIKALPRIDIIFVPALSSVFMALFILAGAVDNFHLILKIIISGLFYFLVFSILRIVFSSNIQKENLLEKDNINILMTGSVLVGNKGSGAMLLGAKKVLIKSFTSHNLRFSLLSPHYERDLAFASKYNVSLFKQEKMLKKTIPLALASKIFSFLPVINNQTIRAFQEADLVVDIAGISYCDTDSFFSSAVKPSSFILLALLLKKPFVKFTQSYGPVKRLGTGMLAKFFLRRCKLVIPRDKESKRLLEKLNIKCSDICVDSAFDMAAEYTEKTAVIKQRTVVGICPNQRIDNYNKDYISLMAKTADYLIEEMGFDVLIIPHYSLPCPIEPAGHHDFDMAGKIVAAAKNKERIFFNKQELLPQELKAVIGSCDFFIGSRYHSLVASISMKVPSLAIGWNHKYQGLFEQAGIEECGLDFKGLNFERIKEKVDYLVKNKEHILNKLGQSHDKMAESSYYAGKILYSILLR